MSRSLKAPIGGSEAFLREFCEEKQRLFETQFQALETYPRKHEAFHLFQQCTGFSQLNYLARATPRSLLLDLCEWYDMCFKRCFENILGQAIPSVAWQQACLPASSGGLGLMTDALEVNGGTCHKSDLAFLVACRATRPAVDALLRSERVFVPLGYETARDELMPHLPNYAMAVQECNGPIAQKEILPSLFEAARRHLVSQICLDGAARIQSCTRSWSAAWVCAQPSAAFDTGLSDVALVDAISMRLGLPVFSAEQACARCPQMLDVYAHHAVTCPMEGGKVRLRNQIRDISSDICQIWRLGLVLNQKVSC